MQTVRLAAGKEKQPLRRHPWVLPRAIAEVTGSPEPGELSDVVRVETSGRRFVAWGWHDPDARTPVRLLSWDEAAMPDDRWLEETIGRSIGRRGPQDPSGAVRLVFGESDGVPGLAVDRYADTAVAQLSGRPAVRRRALVARVVASASGCRRVRCTTDDSIARLDGLPALDEWVVGAAPDGPVICAEGHSRFAVDVCRGQKTGFYLDQRENRAAIGSVAKGRLLDAFSYSGGFACAAGNARAVCVDSSPEAARLVRRNAELNGAVDRIEFVRADVFDYLREGGRDGGTPFDVIVLDPPKMARGERDVERALRAYKDLVLHAVAMLAPGGRIAVFSCSAAIGWAELHRACAWAALDAGRPLRAERWFSQSGDHPVLASFPESHYLTGFLWHVE